MFVPDDLNDRLAAAWQRGLRFAARAAIAFGLSTAAGIGIGAAATDNAFAQIIVTILGALGFWVPFLFVVTRVDQFLTRRRSRPAQGRALGRQEASRAAQDWQRLIALAPSQSERLIALRRSLQASRAELGRAELDPDAHELCVLIDRRLPELIHRELDNLAPGDPDRRRQLSDLVDLIEQFARHCSRKRIEGGRDAAFEAAVLRRRFEARLSEF